MAAFYRQFGWPEAPSSVPEHVVFQCTNGVVLGLYSATVYERQIGNAASEFRGFTVAINCEDARAVFCTHEELGEFDDIHELDEQPQHSGWGCGFSFRDPEGNVWEVAWKDGSDFDHRGGFIYP
jgi:glyoxalase/bleomycin resistance protein/dioxygenase superfamily protein